MFWGFQPLYWALFPDTDSYVMLFVRIVLSALFSVLLLALTHRAHELKELFRNRAIMKYLAPAALFLFFDWAVFIVAVNSGHVLDCSLGYYINPLILFGFGVLIYKESCSKLQLISLCVAAVGVIISTVAYGDFPWLALVIAFNWSIYAMLKKNVPIDGVLSIAAETLMMTPVALILLFVFKRPELMSASGIEIPLLLGSGIVTALPMFIFSDCVSRLPLIIMCFGQYLGPTFNLICGVIMHETFSRSEIVSFVFFISAVILFTVGEMRMGKIKD